MNTGIPALDALVGRQTPGGCPDCDAFQTVERVAVENGHHFYRMTVAHDDGCPWLSGVCDLPRTTPGHPGGRVEQNQLPDETEDTASLIDLDRASSWAPEPDAYGDTEGTPNPWQAVLDRARDKYSGGDRA